MVDLILTSGVFSKYTPTLFSAKVLPLYKSPVILTPVLEVSSFVLPLFLKVTPLLLVLHLSFHLRVK